MPYLPPEGFLPYPGSPLFYRAEQGTDPQTGAPCRWVTYFDTERGSYHQVAYPLPPAAPEPPAPAPQPAPTPTGAPPAQPETAQAEAPPVPAGAPSTAPPGRDPRSEPSPAPVQDTTPPKKKGKGGLLALLILLPLVAAVLLLWLTGAYTKLPFFTEQGHIRPAHASQTAPPGSSSEDPAQAALDAFRSLLVVPALGDELPEALDDPQLRAAMERMMAQLLQCMEGAQVTAQLVASDGKTATVILSSPSRLDLRKTNVLADGEEMLRFLDEQFQSSDSQPTETELATRFLDFLTEQMAQRWETELVTEVENTVTVTLTAQGDGWVLDTPPQALSRLVVDYDGPDVPIKTLLLGNLTEGVDVPAVVSEPFPLGTYSYTGDAPYPVVVAVFLPAGELRLTLNLGGDEWYPLGTYAVSGREITLQVELDEYGRRAFPGQETVTLRWEEDGSLAVTSSAGLGAMDQGARLDLVESYLDDGDLTGYVPSAWSWETEGAGYGLDTFTSGKYLREDGRAVLYLDSSDGPDGFSYLLYALADGGKQYDYENPGFFDSSMNGADVYSGGFAEDTYSMNLFRWWEGGSITVSTRWPEDDYITYPAIDGTYRLVREKI